MKNEIEDYSLSEIFAQAKAIQDKKATDAEKLPALFDKVLDALVDTSEKLNALTARHRDLQNLVTSEIADFFAGQEQPGEAVGAEEQHKALMARVFACFDEKSLESCESKRSKPLSPDDVVYPVDQLIKGDSPCAFYLFPEVEFIRISQKHFFEEWQDPREQSNQGGENL